MDHKTVHDKNFKILDIDHEFEYQKELTDKLDSDISDFTQQRLNEIVLWKVNRYANFDNKVIELLNQINIKSNKINLLKTEEVLKCLLNIKGVGLAMASSILRFKNPNIYQIIDQRVFRIIYKKRELKLSNYKSKKNVDTQIKLYLQYLKDLISAF